MIEKETGYITVGEVLGAHGQKGALRVRVLTEFPERFKKGAELFIEGIPYKIESSKPGTNTAIISLQGIDTPQAAKAMSHKSLDIPESARKVLPAGRYYQHDIIGLDVWTTGGIRLGKVSKIINTGGNDIYVVNENNKEVLIPVVKDIVKNIDLPSKKITIEEVEGLLG